MEYYLAIKKKEILLIAITWMDLEDIMLSEISQTEKDKYCVISVGEMGDVVQRVQTSSYRMNKFWGSNVQPGDCY